MILKKNVSDNGNQDSRRRALVVVVMTTDPSNNYHSFNEENDGIFISQYCCVAVLGTCFQIVYTFMLKLR